MPVVRTPILTRARQTGAPEKRLAMCPNCDSADLVKVEMAVGEQPVRFSHCRRCEYRWWADRDTGSRLPLADVLTTAE
jgi:formate dehydrogenase maturation protein FdhE